MKTHNRFFASLTTLVLVGLSSLSASVPEPSTLFYGKVLHRAHGQEHQLTAGSLTWVLSDQEGTEYRFDAELEDIKGVFSYRIAIPHQALSSGLSVDPSVIPLGAGEKQYDFVSIEVDGYPAAILWSEIDFIKLLQNSRAATHRIDLLVSFDLLDSDGDGMPDWWETFYGLDWQNPEANLDTDGDGWSNLEEFYNGTDPLHDDRAPSVKTFNLAAYGQSNNGVWLRSADSDSSADELTYTITALPTGGYLHYIPVGAASDAPDLSLAVGDTFTQAELNRGAVAYRHSDTNIVETSFELSLSDGSHDPFTAEITVAVFPPQSSSEISSSPNAIPEWWRDENVVFEAYWGLRENVISGDLIESALLYLLGKDYGWTLWDQRAQTLPVTIETSGSASQFILSGSGDDILRGGPADDILNGGEGADILAGGAGLDLFIVSDLGLETIEDFNIFEDVLDLGDLFIGQSGTLNSFLQVDSDGTDTYIRIDQDGDGSGFTDAAILLMGNDLSQDDLHRLWSVGQLLTAGLDGYPSITIENLPAEALEEGYSTADLILRRNGPGTQALTVTLAISGSATNGTDYDLIDNEITFGPGKRTVTVTVDPILDGLEDPEQLNLGVVSGAGYVSGLLASAEIQIVDAKQRFSIFASEPSTVVNGDPVDLLVERRGPRSGSVRVRLSRSGSAVHLTDYAQIPSYVEFGNGDIYKYITIEALPAGTLGSGESSETVTVSIRPPVATEYYLGETNSATVRLLSSEAAFDAWAAELPEANEGMSEAELTQVVSSRTGLQALLEYALSYGLELEDGVAPEEQSLMRPVLERTEDGFEFEFNKRLNDSRLNYIVECSSNLSTWHSGDAYFVEVPLSEEESNAGRTRYRVINSEGEDPVQCFIRVRVELND